MYLQSLSLKDKAFSISACRFYHSFLTFCWCSSTCTFEVMCLFQSFSFTTFCYSLIANLAASIAWYLRSVSVIGLKGSSSFRGFKRCSSASSLIDLGSFYCCFLADDTFFCFFVISSTMSSESLSFDVSLAAAFSFKDLLSAPIIDLPRSFKPSVFSSF